MTPIPKNKQIRSQRYLDWIDKQPCIVSGQKATHHHIRDWWTDGGTGKKPSDIYAIPLSSYNHTDGPDAIHQIGHHSWMERHYFTTEDLMKIVLDLHKRFLSEGNKF
jgi:hypothetical protein